MAVVYPAASDNWSTVANWMSGGNPYGQLPQSGDIVCANGKTVTIDMDLAAYTFDRLTTAATAPAVAGGGFTCAITNTILGDIVSGSSVCLTLSHGAGVSVYLSGNFTGGSSAYGQAVLVTGVGTTNHLGNITGGGSYSGMAYSGNPFGLRITGAGIYNHTGNIYAANMTAVKLEAAGTFNSTGTATSSASMPAIYTAGYTNIYYNGVLSMVSPPSATIPTIFSDYAGTGTVYFAGIAINTTTTACIYSPRIAIVSGVSAQWTFVDNAASTKTLYSTDTAMFGYPAEGDTRDGVTYGQANEFLGTLKVPAPATVLLGVPTDATTGTLLMTPADVINELNTSMVDVAVRLRNCSTPDITGDQIVALVP